MDYVIPGFEDMTPQEVFDLSAKHILTTRTKSMRRFDSGERCAYSGSGCAASVFLTKPAIADIEHVGADSSQDWCDLVNEGVVPHTNEELISEMQHAHDDAPADCFMQAWEAGMRHIAQRFSLSTAVFDAFGEG